MKNLDKSKALEIYFSLIKYNDDNPEIYDRIANLIINKFKFSESLYELNPALKDYQKATLLFRQGDIDEAIDFYKDIIKKDRYCYPAILV